MTAPAMLAHLCDQMRMPFNERPGAPIPGVPRLPLMRAVALYLLPWPKGAIVGPPEAFASEPGPWEEDVARLKRLVEEFVTAAPRTRWLWGTAGSNNLPSTRPAAGSGNVRLSCPARLPGTSRRFAVLW